VRKGIKVRIMTELNEAITIGKKMVYIAIIAGLINFIPGIAISENTTSYFNWILLGIGAIFVAVLTYGSLLSKKDIEDTAGLLINMGWLLVAIGLAIVCSAFSEFYFVSWSSGIFNVLAALLLIFPIFYFMSLIIKKTNVSIVP
jgi:hypothetical protein